jgi:transposase
VTPGSALSASLFCYEAGPTGYGLHRQITALGHDCSVIAPSLIPKRPGEHVKTNHRDAVALARLHRAGELTTIWVPDLGHEAIRDLVRAREAAMEDLREKRQHLQSFLLRHGQRYPGLRPWTLVHARWLSNLTFEHPAQYLVLREYRQAIEDAEARLERLTQQVTEVVSTWSMAGRSLPSHAWRCVSDCRHLRGGNRRRASLRNSAATDGLSRPRPFGALNW